MKRNDARNFCILYLEPGDDRDALFRAISGQHKPVVLMLAQQSRLFQHPEEFVALKHLKRQLNVAIFFVIASGEHLAQIESISATPLAHLDYISAEMKGRLAERNGFPVYKSMDALNDALMVGYPAPQHILPHAPGEPTSAAYRAPRKTVPLTPLEEIVAHMQTMPLPAVSPSQQPIRSSTPRPTVPAAAPEPVPPSAPLPKRSYRRLPAVLIAFMILALSGAGLGSLLVLFHSPPVNMQAVLPSIVGHVYFLSSGQVNENTNQGIDDEAQVDLSNLTNPAPGNSYYLWLLSDKNQGERTAVFLGVLAVKNGNAHLFYAGDQLHTNLLAITSRFLVTEEDSAVTPIAPSPDYSTWRYYGEFLQTPVQTSVSGMGGSMTSFSFLDHLRHLLAADPMLDQNELPGGLNNWFSRNMEKVLEWTSSMRESWQESKDMPFIRRQTVRTLAYLDGISYVSQDLSPNTPLNVNGRLARLGLIEVNGPNQDPPCYLDSIVFHLNGLIQAGGSTTTLRKDAAEIIAAMNNVRYWLGQVRKDAQQIVKMTDEQLLQPSTLALINDMTANASNAYAGQIEPMTGEMREGVTWIHDHMQALATLEVTAYRAANSPIQMIPEPSRSVWYQYEGKS